jgi:uncharacterized OB-fold protein
MDAPLTWQEQVTPEAFDNDILPFWEALKSHQFVLYTCQKCGQHYWPMTLCRNHDDVTFDDMKWEPTSGKGQVFTWVVAHRLNNPAHGVDGPYALVMVELDEGPIFPTRLSGRRPEDLRVGMRVEIDYCDVPKTGMTLPLFRPAD